MISLAILTMVSGMLFTLAQSLNQAAVSQEAKIAAQDEARQGMELVVNELRQAAISSLVGPFPGPSISYRVAGDVDNNGTAVDRSGNLELLPARTIRRDAGDANGDRRTTTQIVLITPNRPVRVVTNNVLLNEDADNNNVLSATEDLNRNGRLDRGIWFERVGQGARITIQAQHRAGPRGPLMYSTLTEIVTPRN
jgi:hypothetical protein